ncbi:MAG TPA: endonuclease III domain-containing protein [Candidatus Angelobacter sp.]|nr:endonuclease III domain-containing protein [Candidatus Angelobacter sp.]
MAIPLPNYHITQSRNPSAPPRLRSEIPQYYIALLARYGPQNWWPARSRFEVIVGAYLTQNTNWSNVEKALLKLRHARCLSVNALRTTPIDELEELIRPSGYFRQKARNLKTFIAFLDRQYSGSLSRMFAGPTEKLRAELLELNGVGPETADSILLYAGNHPVFVVDAYTRRVLLRHGIIHEKTSYEEIRSMVELTISSSEAESLVVKSSGSDPRHPVSRMSSSARTELAQHYNELHALIVRVGNHYCRTKPICEGCPLQTFLKPDNGATAQGAPESY